MFCSKIDLCAVDFMKDDLSVEMMVSAANVALSGNRHLLPTRQALAAGIILNRVEWLCGRTTTGAIKEIGVGIDTLYTAQECFVRERNAMVRRRIF